MTPNYNNLWKLLIEKGMTKTDLRIKAEMSTSTLAKMGKNEVVSMNVIIKICEILDCNVSDVMTVDKISEQTSLYIIYNIQEERQQGKLLGVLEKEERQDRQKIKKSLAYFPNMKKARFRNRVFCLGNDSYTTNAVEGFHRMLRKFTKTKTNFPTDDSLKKSIYLSVKEISKKWNNPVRDWGKIIGQFMMFFEERFGEIRTA